MSTAPGAARIEPPADVPFRLAPRWPADARVLAAAIVVGIATDVAVRSGAVSLAGGVTVALASVAILATGRVTNPQARAAVALAPLFGVWLFVRSSPWLIPLDVVAAGGLLVVGASLAREGTVWDLSIPQALLRGLHAVVHGALGVEYALASVGGLWAQRRGTGRQRGTIAVIRGALMALPVVLLLGLLLASADAVFASFFRWDVAVDPASVAVHIVAVTAGAWIAGGLLRVASSQPPGPIERRGWRLGRVEATVILGSLAVLFGTFGVAQVVALSDGGRRVIETAGVTYAEYGRSGFFQLLAVAAITLSVLMAIRATTRHLDRGRGVLLVLSEIAVALTLVIVVVAVRRLSLYEDVFGLTMLRLFSTLFALWIGGVFVLLGLVLAGVGARRSWLPAGAATLGLSILLMLNVVSPEAVVVRHNVAHAERTGRFDPAYLADLSDDAVPTLVALLPRLAEGDRAGVLASLCPPRPPAFTGWAAYNLSHDRAFEALVEACRGTGGQAP